MRILPSESMLKNLFTSRDLSSIKAIAHGKAKDKVAGTIYSKEMQRDIPSFLVYDAGLSVHPAYRFLGATPDCKVFDPSAEIPYGLLELKCPFSKKDDTLEQVPSNASFYLEKVAVGIKLKQDHNCGYYAQVQGQLALTGLKWCDFCVFLS